MNIIELDGFRWGTFSEESEKKMTRMMRDFLGQARIGDWQPDGDWYTLKNKFYGFAEKHADGITGYDDGWRDTDVEECVVWVMRKVASGARWA